MDRERRWAGLRAGMEAQGLDLVVYGHCPSYQYLTGSTADWREAPDHQPDGDVLLVPREGDPLLLESGAYPAVAFPEGQAEPFGAGYADAFRRFAGARRIGLGAYLPAKALLAATEAFPGAVFSGAAGLLDSVRAIKEPE